MSPPRRVSPSPEDIRRHNLGAVLSRLHRYGPATRAQLAELLGLNRSTIKTLTADLGRAELIAESSSKDNGKNGAGRPSLVVRPRAEQRYAYVFSVEADLIRGARVGLGGRILDRAQRRHEPGGVGASVAALLDDIRGAPDHGLVGVGIAVPSPADGERAGELSRDLGDVLGGQCPVHIGRAVDLSAMAEAERGAGVGATEVIYLHGDIAVSAAIIADGRLLTGGNGFAGQVGHMVVRPQGRRCDCGGRGCWQTEIGQRGLLDSAGREGHMGADAVTAVVEAARRGDVTAERGLRQAADWLAFGLGNLINVFNPQLVLFAGTLRQLYLASAATVRSRLRSVALPTTRQGLRLRTPQLGDDAVLLGAAELAFEDLLNNPLRDM